jgi:hypothetical protein
VKTKKKKLESHGKKMATGNKRLPTKIFCKPKLSISNHSLQRKRWYFLQYVSKCRAVKLTYKEENITCISGKANHW